MSLMANKLNKLNLSKFGYTEATPKQGLKAAAAQSATESRKHPPASADGLKMDAAAVKADILSELRADISSILKSELHKAFAEEFGYLKKELQEVKSEIVGNRIAVRSELDAMKATIVEVEENMSSWSDVVTTLQADVADYKTELEELQLKCDDMQSRMRRSNIRITGALERPGSCSPAAISELLKTVINNQKNFPVDRSHRGLAPSRNGKPRVIIAKLHYDQDAVEVLRKARQEGPFQYKGSTIFIYPDRTARDAKICASFNSVRLLLKNRRDVRYGYAHPSRFLITFRGATSEFKDPKEAMAYVKNNIPATEEATDDITATNEAIDDAAAAEDTARDVRMPEAVGGDP